MFKTIKPKRISDYIVEQIENLIRKGTLKPDDKLLPERELAKKFNVSRSSVREALNILQEKGLIVSIQGDGTFIRPLTDSIVQDGVKSFMKRDPATAWELMDIRKTLELWAVKRATEMLDENSANAIKEMFYDLEKDYKLGKRSENSDTEFHLSVIKAAKNTVLTHMMTSIFQVLRDAVDTGREYLLDVKGFSKEKLFNQHKMVFDAIIKKDPLMAENNLRKHLSFIDKDFKEYLYKMYNAKNKEKMRISNNENMN